MTTIKSMFLGRRQPSKSKQNNSAPAALVAATTTTKNATAPANELDKLLKVASFEESAATEDSRDDVTPFERFLNDSTNALSNVFSEAVSLADDIQTIISADIDDDVDDDVYSVVKATPSSKEVVKGSHSDLAKEIKKLGKLGQRRKKAEKQIRKCENEISMAEAEKVKTLIKIKALSQKFELQSAMDRADDDERNERSVEDEEGGRW